MERTKEQFRRVKEGWLEKRKKTEKMNQNKEQEVATHRAGQYIDIISISRY